MNILEGMNPQQKEAVEYTEGPLLILAGAGSGKTRVLTHRIAYLIENKGVKPYHIMAITFTNKAAQEMRERVDQIVEFGSESIWVSTFHSSCVRILRRFIDRIGYANNFTIYDTDDQKTVMKHLIKKLQLDTKLYKERSLMSAISSAKNEMILPEQFEKNAGLDWKKKKIAQVYYEYQAELKKNNALDFDDLLVKTVALFQRCPDVLEFYQDKFQYLMVDEYQDTNMVQFKFISLLAAKYRNLCVVGDDDQSIYKFRGADIGNILGFEKVFPDAKVIKLEQNYRSTQNILNAANEVIANNEGRKVKRLWTENEEGSKLDFREFQNGFEEAEYVTGEISRMVREGQCKYGDVAVLYRTNAQSRLFEEKFLLANVPYKIVGGVNFYARKEIKDLLAYLKTIDNAQDDLAVQRIINVPKRGIGAASISRVSVHATEQDINFYDALLEAPYIPGIGRSLNKIESFTNFIQKMRTQTEYYSVKELLEHIIEETGYVKELEAEDTEESKARIENIDEFISKIVTYEEENEQPDLSGFLQEVALVSDIDSVDSDSDYVLLMTLHSAKGLEFPYVYLAGMEDGIFPSYMTITGDDPGELEEERRLCYVGITRAKKHLTLTSARQRMIRGETQYNKVSRFVRELPRELVDLGKDSYRDSGNKKERMGEFPDSRFGGMTGKKSSFGNTFKPRQFTVTKAEKLKYGVGDTVRHIKFGVGEVLDIVDGGKDYEVTVKFDRAGVKKMFASFAKLKKI
ncbi:DNA helicase PcrA [Novisyntrophococcus fermenticellae]|uniref:DNA helicase PcrA n=1 Tax=Novisyntrophococcus fermenticellae TaxID=2068655 RepID=UPI001E497D01|nr:DNA helicase PcrA [Novisyntrophococcus fermenticellae]